METSRFLTTRQNPWNPIAELRREMDSLFDDFWSVPSNRRWETESSFVPACDVEESDDHFLLTLEMPGIPREDIKVELVGNQLVVSGERKSERRSDGSGKQGLWYSERRYGKFQRAFPVSSGMDTSKIEAHFQDGVLRLLIPKAATAKAREIKVASGTPGGFFGKLLGEKKGENAA